MSTRTHSDRQVIGAYDCSDINCIDSSEFLQPCEDREVYRRGQKEYIGDRSFKEEI